MESWTIGRIDESHVAITAWRTVELELAKANPCRTVAVVVKPLNTAHIYPSSSVNGIRLLIPPRELDARSLDPVAGSG
jgi:hypothetical protein